MTTEAVATFFALVLLGSALAFAVLLSRRQTRATVTESALPITAAVAVGATAGSLYLSEVANFVPCELCWMQRIAMYPLAVILVIAAWRRDHNVLRYTLVLSTIGLAISIYHVQLQLFPDQGSHCDLATPCTAKWVEAFGWMTIPQMAGLSFLLIVAATAATLFDQRQEVQ